MKQKSLVPVIVLVVVLCSVAWADNGGQFWNFTDLIEDTAEEELEPLVKIFGSAMGAGLFDTGSVHGLGGFDMGLKVPVVFISDKLKAESIVLSNEEFDLPVIPVPMFQGSVGLPYNFNFMMRILKTPSFDEVPALTILGFGGKYGLLQQPVLPKVALVVGFTRLYGMDELDVVDSFSLTTWSLGAAASQDIWLATLYYGLAYEWTSLDIALDPEKDPDFAGTPVDPFSVGVSVGGVRWTSGAKLNLALFTLNADVALAPIRTMSAGIGFNFR